MNDSRFVRVAVATSAILRSPSMDHCSTSESLLSLLYELDALFQTVAKL
ncbi:hypothetical protein [Phormidesmis priestleyi]|nr:hypothetical protein [Phormidesmis priestleyi]